MPGPCLRTWHVMNLLFNENDIIVVNPSIFLQFFYLQMFNKLKQEFPNYRNKIFGINGDCSSIGLGLSEIDRKIICAEVSVCFHGAATVR